MTTPVRLDISAIAKKLVAQRTAKRLEQTEVAEQAGLSRAYVSRLEKGLVPNPKLLDLAQVAGVLEITVAELVNVTGPTREIRIAQYADVLDQLADEPPEIAETIVRWLRESMEIARTARQVRTN